VKRWELSRETAAARGLRAGADAMGLLSKIGVPYPEGSAANVSQDGRWFFARNTDDNLELIGRLVGSNSNSFEESDYEIQNKAQRLVIRRLELREATMKEAVAYVERQCLDLDFKEENSSKRGIPFITKYSRNEPVNPTRITISLTNIPVYEALKYVTSLCNHKFTVERYAVFVEPMDSSENKLRTYIWGYLSKDLEEAGMKGVAELRKFLIGKGVKFPAGSVAFYDSWNRCLYFRNTFDNVDIMYGMILCCPRDDREPAQP
jgi:hypothetical protein